MGDALKAVRLGSDLVQVGADPPEFLNRLLRCSREVGQGHEFVRQGGKGCLAQQGCRSYLLLVGVALREGEEMPIFGIGKPAVDAMGAQGRDEKRVLSLRT